MSESGQVFAFQPQLSQSVPDFWPANFRLSMAYMPLTAQHCGRVQVQATVGTPQPPRVHP
jgi:hypothetical protein